MKLYTAHFRDGREPVLLKEGFSWGALLFGPFWLFWRGAWVAGALVLAAGLATFLLPPLLAVVLFPAEALLLGLSGYDLLRWSMEHRRYLLVQVVAGRNEFEALGRLLRSHPDLTRRVLATEAVR